MFEGIIIIDNLWLWLGLWCCRLHLDTGRWWPRRCIRLGPWVPSCPRWSETGIRKFRSGMKHESPQLDRGAVRFDTTWHPAWANHKRHSSVSKIRPRLCSWTFRKSWRMDRLKYYSHTELSGYGRIWKSTVFSASRPKSLLQNSEFEWIYFQASWFNEFSLTDGPDMQISE